MRVAISLMRVGLHREGARGAHRCPPQRLEQANCRLLVVHKPQCGRGTFRDRAGVCHIRVRFEMTLMSLKPCKTILMSLKPCKTILMNHKPCKTILMSLKPL